MTRLTKELRSAILKNVLIHRFEKEANEIALEHAQIANAVFVDSFPASQRKDMLALPDGWLPTENRIKVKFGATVVELNFNGYGSPTYSLVSRLQSKPREQEYRRLPYKFSTYGGGHIMNVYEATHPLAERYGEFYTRIQTLINEHKAAELQTTTALSKFTTIEKLVEAWPEIEPLLPKIKATATNLPMVPVDTLNKILDLPVAN